MPHLWGVHDLRRGCRTVRPSLHCRPHCLRRKIQLFSPRAVDSRLAKDAKGRILTYESPYQRLTIWDAEGTKVTSCALPAALASFKSGMVGLSEDRAVIVLHGDPTTLVVVDVPRCEVKARAQIAEMIPLEFFAAPLGWTVAGPRTDGKGYSAVRLDLKGKVTESYSLPDEIDADLRTRFAPGPASRALPIVVAGDLWLIPGSTYMLTRPAQKGRDEYVLEPPACLSAQTRELRGDERVRYTEDRLKNATDPGTKKEMNRLATAAREGRGQTFLAAIAAAASYGDFLGLIVRYERAGHTGCRLDIWNLSNDSLSAIVPIGESCSNFLALTEESAWILRGGELVNISLPPLALPLKQPCTEFYGVAKALRDEAPAKGTEVER